MPFPLIPLALGGLSFLGGALGNRKRTQTQTSTTRSSTTPEAEGMNQMLMEMIRSRLRGSADLSGYSAEGIKGINDTFGDVSTALSADLTARGLSDSPAAGAPLSRLAVGRGGAISQFRNSLPLLQRELQGDDLGMAARLYAMQPRTTTTTGTATQPGNMLGGGFSSMGLVLADLFMNGAFGNQPLLSSRQNPLMTRNLWGGR